MQTTNTICFYICFANVELKVVAPWTWYKYFEKLYDGSEIIRCSRMSQKKPDGALYLEEVKSKTISFEFSVHPDLKKYTIRASDSPLFLCLSAHQCIARTLNILFHRKGGIVLHSSVALIDGKALLFVGESGRGKSTIVDFLHTNKPDVDILSDNSAFIIKRAGRFMVYPSPYVEANRLNSLQKRLPLQPPYEIGAIFFPYHATYNKIQKLGFQNRLKLLQYNSHIPFQPHKLFNTGGVRTFGKLIFDLIDSVNMYKLEFEKGPGFIRYLSRYVPHN